MPKIAVPYVIRRVKASRRRGRRVYLYWHPPKRYLIAAAMQPRRLAADMPIQATEADLYAVAVPEAIRLNQEMKRRLAAASVQDPAEIVGTLPWLIREWQRSPEYLLKRESTRKNGYDYACRLLTQWSERNGHPPVKKLQRKAVWAFREGLYQPDPATGGIRLRRAQLVLAVLRLVLELAYNRGLIPSNPARKLRAVQPKARDQIWTDEQIESFVAKAIELGRFSLALAVRLAADVALRREDIISASWHQFKGRSLRVRQQKTGRWIDVPALDELLALLKRAPRGPDAAPVAAIDGTTQRYSRDYFSHEVRRIMNAAGLPHDLQFRDLRRTAVVHMGRAGLAPSLITAVSGHDVDECMRILEVYMPRDSDMARRAIERMRAYRAEVKAQRTKADEAHGESSLEAGSLT